MISWRSQKIVLLRVPNHLPFFIAPWNLSGFHFSGQKQFLSCVRSLKLFSSKVALPISLFFLLCVKQQRVILDSQPLLYPKVTSVGYRRGFLHSFRVFGCMLNIVRTHDQYCLFVPVKMVRAASNSRNCSSSTELPLLGWKLNCFLW